MAGWRVLVAALFCFALVAGCSRRAETGSPSERTISSVVVSDSVSLRASDVQRNAGRVVADSVVLESPGYLVAYEDGGGAPGRILAVSDLLPAGETRDVEVVLSGGLAAGSSIWLLLHAEDGESKGFGLGVGDPPLRGDAGVGVLKVKLLPDSGRS